MSLGYMMMIMIAISISGQWSNEAAGELLVRDAHLGSDSSANAQPPPRRDDVSQRTEVRAPFPGPSWGAFHVGSLQRYDQQAEQPKIR